ncbi:MAG: hypothetical protein JWN68_3593 [Nocardioides sp.]|jgi:hypothetical protein|uniref:hypothetical protein n=1 Tax=Nocardioides sp. TaxID=35761 RepID=UPI0026374BB3|nr:hypothetical protein [Nocardioides sp.]MCW2835640.1 hypothetical protein [Nocardioides sp.]
MTTEPFRPSDLGATPGVIPYVEFHTGPRRLLTIDLSLNSKALVKWYPIVSIDGRQYVVVPGPVSWEIPADRNVHVSAHLDGEVLGRAPASFILPPGEGREFLTYSTRSGAGSLIHASPPPTHA